MNKRLILWATVLAAGLAWASMAQAHPGIELRSFTDLDQDGIGDPIRTGLTGDTLVTLDKMGNPSQMVKGSALSPKQSCALCHDYDGITSAYHFQMGRDETIDANRDGFKDDFGSVVAGEEGLLASLPTLRNIVSPGQFGAW